MSRRSKPTQDSHIDGPSRTRRVGVVIRAELSEIIASDINDPKVGHVTITGVDVSPDLKYANIFVNHLTGDETQSLASVAALNHATGFLRRQLARRMTQRVTPALVFKYDNSIENGMRLSQLIDGALEEGAVGAGAIDADVGQATKPIAGET